MHTQTLVSVIVPTRNSAGTLGQCLASIRDQTHPDVEVVVVDNHSEDGTPELARGYTEHVHTYGPERSAQRNYGVKQSTGEYVLILDSDMVLTPRVLEQCVSVMSSQPSLSALVVPEVSVGTGFWARCKTLERNCYIGDADIEAARFFTREAFLKHGGYDESLHAGEDWDLPQRIRAGGGLIGRIDARIEHQEGKLSLIATMRKKYYYGKSLHLYASRHKDRSRSQFRLIRPAFIRNWRYLLSDPVHTSGMLFMKVCEFAAGGLGYAQARLSPRSGFAR